FGHGPTYLASGSDRKAEIHVAAGCGLVEPVAGGIDDDRADVLVIERVVHTQEGTEPGVADLPFPAGAQVGGPPGGRARVQRVADQIVRCIGLLYLRPDTAQRARLRP